MADNERYFEKHVTKLLLFLVLSLCTATYSTKEQEVCQQRLPIISLKESQEVIAQQIGEASRSVGFFYVIDHDVPEEIVDRLVHLSRDFFALPMKMKREIEMSKGGKAWRGYFSNGEEVTSSIPDEKEGIYFGRDIDIYECSGCDSKPLHGRNIYPKHTLGIDMKSTVDSYMMHMERLGHAILNALVASLGLNPVTSKLSLAFKHDPTILFRIFNYPPHQDEQFPNSYGVGKHSDYGFITILYQDGSGGLEVELANSTWVDAAPVKNSFVINLGDSLEHATGGLIRATPHRVKPRIDANSGRISMPFFFDPAFDSYMSSVYMELSEELKQLAIENRQHGNKKRRWDNLDLRQYEGTTYGEYLMMKVSQVFPQLAGEVL